MPRSALLLLTLAACTGKTPEDTGPPDDGQPHITILSPTDGETVGTCPVLQVKFQNFTLVDYTTTPDPVEGEGHWVVDFGDRYFVCEAFTCAVDLTGQVEGPLTLVAKLVLSDHSPVYNDDGDVVEDEVAVEYSADDCGDTGS